MTNGQLDLLTKMILSPRPPTVTGSDLALMQKQTNLSDADVAELVGLSRNRISELRQSEGAFQPAQAKLLWLIDAVLRLGNLSYQPSRTEEQEASMFNTTVPTSKQAAVKDVLRRYGSGNPEGEINLLMLVDEGAALYTGPPEGLSPQQEVVIKLAAGKNFDIRLRSTIGMKNSVAEMAPSEEFQDSINEEVLGDTHFYAFIPKEFMDSDFVGCLVGVGFTKAATRKKAVISDMRKAYDEIRLLLGDKLHATRLPRGKQ